MRSNEQAHLMLVSNKFFSSEFFSSLITSPFAYL